MAQVDLVSAIVVTFNSQRTIQKCLDSILQAEGNLEVIVVDNASEDQTVEIVKKYSARKVKLIQSSTNAGFSKGNNLGVKYALGDYLLFINPDTEVIQKDAILNLLEILKSHPELGLVGPKLVLADGHVQPSVRNFPTLINAFKEYVLNIKSAYDFYYPEDSSQEVITVDTVVGACMLLSGETFAKVGRFDERYFLYYEDIELCKAIYQQGLKVGFVPSVEFKHILGVSGKGQPTSIYLQRSAQKYHNSFEYLLLQLIFLLQRIKNKL